jgi:anti-sigma factor RsiW
MKAHDSGVLRAYLDGELTFAERAALAAHLDQCAACATELKRLQEQASRVAVHLDKLEAGSVPTSQAALAAFHDRQAQAQPAATGSWLENVTRSLEMIRRSALSPRWRPAMVALSAVMVVALLLSIAPVRSAAADFLGLFRVRKFAVIPLDAQQMARLEQLTQQAEGVFSEPQVVREEGPDQPVADAAQASALAGYTVRTPGRVPEGAGLQRFVVKAGPAVRMEFDRATLETLLQAAGAPVAGLPQTEKITIDVDVANFAVQEYSGGSSRLEFLQVPSPQVNLPEGIDPVALAETGFLFLGMPQEDARRLATSIDWTSTVVIPMPSNAGKAREVTVDGVTGLLLEGTNSSRRNNALVWEKDGILYFMNGRNMDERLLLEAADSLQ